MGDSIGMGRNTAGRWDQLAKFQLSRTLPILCSWKPEARSCKLDTRCNLDCSGAQHQISKASGIRTMCMHLGKHPGQQVWMGPTGDTLTYSFIMLPQSS